MGGKKAKKKASNKKINQLQNQKKDYGGKSSQSFQATADDKSQSTACQNPDKASNSVQCSIFSNSFKNNNSFERVDTAKSIIMVKEICNNAKIDTFSDLSAVEIYRKLKGLKKNVYSLWICFFFTRDFEGGIHGNDGGKLTISDMHHAVSAIKIPIVFLLNPCLSTTKHSALNNRTKERIILFRNDTFSLSTPKSTQNVFTEKGIAVCCNRLKENKEERLSDIIFQCYKNGELVIADRIYPSERCEAKVGVQPFSDIDGNLKESSNLKTSLDDEKPILLLNPLTIVRPKNYVMNGTGSTTLSNSLSFVMNRLSFSPISSDTPKVGVQAFSEIDGNLKESRNRKTSLDDKKPILLMNPLTTVRPENYVTNETGSTTPSNNSLSFVMNPLSFSPNSTGTPFE